MSIRFDQPLRQILTIEKVFYHDIKHNVKDLVQNGLLILFIGKSSGKEVLVIRIGHFVIHLLEHITVVKCTYEKASTYYLVSRDQEFVSSISFDKANIGSIAFEEHIGTHCLVLEGIQLQTTNMPLYDLMDTHWEGFNIRPVVTPDKVQQFIGNAGEKMEKGIVNLSVKIRRLFNKGDNANPENYQQHQQPPQDQLEPQQQQAQVMSQSEPPSRFKALANKLSSAWTTGSNALSKVTDPVIIKGRSINDKVCLKIDKGQNQTLKYLKDLAAVSNDAVSNVFTGVKTAIKNKETLYLTVASQQVGTRYDVVPEMGDQQKTPIPDALVTSPGIKNSLLNKSEDESLDGQIQIQERL